MKIAALDLGDRWIGIATCDPLEIVASPLKTTSPQHLDKEIINLINNNVSLIVVGLPKTMRNTESAQTKKIISQFEDFKQKYPHIDWMLWDERLTSQQAQKIARKKQKEDKLLGHAIAAALILESFLEHRRMQNQE